MPTNKELEARIRALEKQLGADLRTHVGIVQDRSTSMASATDATISGYNEYLSELRKNDDDECLLTLCQFDTESEVIYEATPLDEVKDLNRDTYWVRGITALYDAIGDTIEAIEKSMEKGDRALIVIMTDGLENASKRYNREQITKRISKLEKKGNWTFVYMGADIDAWAGGMTIGIGQTLSYGKIDSHDHYAGLAAATNTMRSGTSMSSGTVTLDVAEDMASKGKQATATSLDPDLWTPGVKEDEDDDDGEG